MNCSGDCYELIKGSVLCVERLCAMDSVVFKL